MQKTRKALSSLLVVGVAGSLAGAGVFSAFSSTTTNQDNTFSAGTVSIGDNDSGAALYQITNAKPGVQTSRCIKVTYTGSLDATVKLYTATPPAASWQYESLTITPGTQASSTFPDCTGFTPTPGAPVFSGTLQSFAEAHNSFLNGFAVNPANGTKWAPNDALVYRFDVAAVDSSAAQGATIGAHAFTWEAQNQ